MPALLCPSPILIDQSFPRSEEELQTVAFALGELIDCVNQDEAHILLTDTLIQFIDLFDWECDNAYPLLLEIHRSLSSLLLSPQKGFKRIPLFKVDEYQPHPIPSGCSEEVFINEWADEMGKILVLHDTYCPNERFYLGIACAYGFAGSSTTTIKSEGIRHFPIVGRCEIHTLLTDAYEWSYLPDWYEKQVSFAMAKKNVQAVGACQIDKPQGDSHYKVHFEGKRPWTLDPNNDPLPTAYLKELEKITPYSLAAIKTALITGEKPTSVCKLDIALQKIHKPASHEVDM